MFLRVPSRPCARDYGMTIAFDENSRGSRVFVYRAALRMDILAQEVANPATLQKIRNAMSYNADEVIHLNTLYGGRYEERTLILLNQTMRCRRRV